MTPVAQPRPLRLGFDLDGVFADFNGHPDTHGFAKLLVEVSGHDLFPRPWVGPPVWGWMSALGYKPSEIAAAWAAVDADPLWWRHLRLLDEPDAETTLMRLWTWIDTHAVLPVFLTTRPSPTAHWQSAEWLQQHLNRPQVCICNNAGDKALLCRALQLDVIVDDCPENLRAVRNHAPDTRRILFARPWNADAVASERSWGSLIVESHLDLVSLIEQWVEAGVAP